MSIFSKNNTAGFSAIELLLSVALIGVLAGLSAPVYQSVQNRNELEVATIASVHALRRAHTLSVAVQADSSWGVAVREGAITLFKGVSFEARDSTFDEVTPIDPTITISGASEYVFERFTGELLVGEITLAGSHGEENIITVNEKGMVSYE